ncbi:MAG: hypothetical protein JSS90_09515 [Bacteroidetes bacterium]|nr:hypothetical protein [Bacteroidota bacterium]
MRKLFAVCFLLCFTGNVMAQTLKSFSTDPSGFLVDMKSFFEETNKKEAERIMDEFKPIFLSKFNADQQQTIITTCNAMLKKRMKAFPDFVVYTGVLTAFSASGKDAKTFSSWHNAFNKSMNKLSVRRLGDFLEISQSLFSNNELYQSSSVAWSTYNSQYSFEFDSLPRIVFGPTTLRCTSKGDSSLIEGTQGVYYPNNLQFYGNGGKVNFNRAGIATNEAYAEAKRYVLNLKSSEYNMDSVTFSYKKYFDTELKGRYYDKLLANVNDSNASYPRFVSYSTNLDIKDLVKDADYRGGFSLQGSKMVGSGNRNSYATLLFKLNGKPQLKLLSQGFIIRPDRIVSINAAAVIYWDKDSIYHPGVEFKYIYKDRTVTLTKNGQTAVNSPYFDSYHKMDLDFDQLVWKVDDPLMDLKMISGGGESKLRFESVNLFSKQRFQSIQGISETNPLYTIKQYAEKNNTKVVSVTELAQYMKLTENTVRNLVLGLSSLGFISYDSDADKFIVKDKVAYYLSAQTGKVDYDELKIESMISGMPNATINLLNFDINMRGVTHVLISDSQEVYIQPFEQELTLKKNRDMVFNGRVHAGRLDFYGKEFSFNYEDFNIDLKNVDSLRFKVPSDQVDQNGKRKLIPIKSILQQLNGKLSIDNPSNKSGFVANDEYPIFVCTNKSFIYYDYPEIYGGVYKRDKFYYHLDPFSIDSLNSLTKEGLVFEGSMVSADIFPEWRQQLTVQADYSLGFTTQTPPGGFTAYNGKGKYRDQISLSHNGFLGKGEVDYLSSTSKSDNIVFFPDSMHAVTQSFAMRREQIGNTKFPEIKSEDVFVNWRPKKDKMYVFKRSHNFDLFNGEAVLDGNLVLMPSGVKSNGVITFQQSQLISDNHYIREHSYGADSAEFKLQSDMTDLLALQTKNVKADIDLDKRIGNFSSNGDRAKVDFPVNQYISYIRDFRWFMDKSELEFGSSDALANNSSEFVSVNKQQDSLRWTAPLASYNLKSYLLKGFKVKEILVADASVIPDQGNVVVERNAVMRPLTNSMVIANTTSRYHTMLNTNITITSSKNYSGDGNYEYLDQTKVKHSIRLTQIGVDTSKQTFAIGEIPDTANFFISPTIQYKGKLRINAAKTNLNFSGYAIVNHNCSMFNKNWFGFSGDIDPKGVNIPIVSPSNETMQKLYSGIYFGSDSTMMYPSFLSPKRGSSDAEVISAEGYLTYNNNSRQYTISGVVPGTDSSKASTVVTNTVVLDDKKCELVAEGRINLTQDFGQLKLGNYGSVTYSTVNDSVGFDEIMAIDFMFNDDALKAMAEMFNSIPALQPFMDDRKVYRNALTNMIGKDKAEKLLNETGIYGSARKIPSELQHTLMLSELKFSYNKERASYISTGKIGLGIIGKTYVGRMVNGKVEIMRRRSGDVLNIYLEALPDMWYYFNYQRGVMQVISKDEKFNKPIDEMKPEKRVASEKGGLEPYQFMLATERKKNEFLKRITDGGL